MLCLAFCFQVDLTPEKSILTHYVSAIAEQTRRGWGLRCAVRPNPAKSIPGGSLLVEKGHLSGDVTMMVSVKEHSVRPLPLLRKHYVFSYSAFSGT